MRFYLFDRVIDFVSGCEASGIKNVSSQEEFLIDHYDRHPVMPNPLIIESLAQLGGWLITVSSDYKYLAVMVMIKGVAVQGEAVPGDQIRLYTRIENINEYGATLTCKASVQETPILQVKNITYVLYEIPQEDREDLKKKYTALSGS